MGRRWQWWTGGEPSACGRLRPAPKRPSPPRSSLRRRRSSSERRRQSVIWRSRSATCKSPSGLHWSVSLSRNTAVECVTLTKGPALRGQWQTKLWGRWWRIRGMRRWPRRSKAERPHSRSSFSWPQADSWRPSEGWRPWSPTPWRRPSWWERASSGWARWERGWRASPGGWRRLWAEQVTLTRSWMTLRSGSQKKIQTRFVTNLLSPPPRRLCFHLRVFVC